MALERDQADQKAINEIMRVTHTLKGLFAATEFMELGKLCHSAEDAMVELTKLGFVDSDTLTILYSFLDKLNEIFSLINKTFDEFSKTQGEEFDFTLLMKKVTERLEVDFSTLVSELQTLTSVDLKIGKKYRLIVSFDPECRLKSARAFQVLTSLEQISKILYANPSKDKLEEGTVFSDLNIVIITQEDEKVIQEQANSVEEVADIQVEKIFDTPTKRDEPKVISSIQSVRVQLSQLDQIMDLLGEIVIERNSLAQQLQLSGEQLRFFSAMDRAVDDLRQLVLKMRLVPLEYIFEHFPRLVREGTKGTNKKAKLAMAGKQVEVDRTSIDLLNEALIHLIRNAVDHGIEPMDVRKSKGKDEQGFIQVTAIFDRNDIVITVEDNGKGIDVEAVRAKAIEDGYIKENDKLDREGLIAILFLSGFSTSEQVTKLSGRGIGLSIAYTNVVEKLSGSINVETQKDIGTRFIIRIPISLSILDALVVQTEDRLFTIPLANVSRVYQISDEKIYYHNQRPFIVVNREVIPVVSVKEKLNLNNNTFTSKVKQKKNTKDRVIMLWEQGGKKIGVQVDAILGQQQIVFKKTDPLMSQVKGFSGYTLIGEGTIVPILDPTGLIGMV